MREDLVIKTKKEGGVVSDLRLEPVDLKEESVSDAYSVAFNTIKENQTKLEDIFVRSIVKKISIEKASYLINFFTKVCINLSDNEIDILANQFKENMRRNSNALALKHSLTDDEKNILITGHKLQGRDPLEVFGIKTMVHFIKLRKKLHEFEPKTIPNFYIEDYLDSIHKIDLVEIFESESGIVVNLIQLKSYAYKQGEEAVYHGFHKRFIEGSLVDIGSYKSMLSKKPEDATDIESFMNDVESVKGAFINVLTSENPSKEKLFEELHIGKGRNKAQRAWIIERYLGFLINEVNDLKNEDIIDQSDYLLILKILDDVNSELIRVSNLTKDLTGISEIYSICATRDGEVSKKLLFSASEDKRKAVVFNKN